MLPDPRQYNPEFHKYVLSLLGPHFSSKPLPSPKWTNVQNMYYDWLRDYEAIHCTEECNDA